MDAVVTPNSPALAILERLDTARAEEAREAELRELLAGHNSADQRGGA
ncbi:hypothetical protein [Plantactinospora sonchi]|uniref:Uncharacterized protein n=1 Tax=Plantactinospora sonchi TaxID=1544735 RepID=A0ABU7RX78_9ACTN